MKQDKLKNNRPTYLVYFFVLLLEQILKKVVEKSILKPGIQFPLQLLVLESLKVFRKSVLHYMVSLRKVLYVRQGSCSLLCAQCYEHEVHECLIVRELINLMECQLQAQKLTAVKIFQPLNTILQLSSAIKPIMTRTAISCKSITFLCRRFIENLPIPQQRILKTVDYTVGCQSCIISASWFVLLIAKITQVTEKDVRW